MPRVNPRKYQREWDYYREGRLASMGSLYDKWAAEAGLSKQKIPISSVWAKRQGTWWPSYMWGLDNLKQQIVMVNHEQELLNLRLHKRSATYFMETINPPVEFLCEICFYDTWDDSCKCCRDYNNFREGRGVFDGQER